MNCADMLELESALLDGELGAGDSRAAQAHLAQCARCQARFKQLQAASISLRSSLEYFRAPASLRSRIGAQIRPATHSPRPATRPGPGVLRLPLSSWWQGWAGGLAMPAVAALLALTVGLRIGGPSVDDRLLEEAIGDHTRALMTDHAIDVASSDQHAVRPWFAGRLDFAPPVRDLAANGFPLAGGRLDYLDHTRVAVLAYRRHQHAIDVFVWPVASGEQPLSPRSRSRRGYNVVRWNDGAMNFCAVSDAAPEDLQQLMGLIRSTPSG